ncbi:MAG: T9SS type A sorting domain-containing protein [Dysgonamonadaceae bacterium]|nr:T9SS type A sorting domain-containing protein [Dysgonamonadaceae bacterium]
MKKNLQVLLFVIFILTSHSFYGQLRYLGLEAELSGNPPIDRHALLLNPKSKIIDNYLFVPTWNGIYRKNLDVIENTEWEMYAFKGMPVKDFVKNGSRILAITAKTQDSLLLLSNDNGMSYINYTSDHFFEHERDHEYGHVNHLYRISQNPQNPNSVIVLHAFYGISKSTDFGLTWRNLSTVIGNYQERFVDFHPTDTATMYYAGENMIFASYIRASFDDGLTWSEVDNIYLGDNCTHYLAFHPTNPNIILTAGEGRITKSVNKGVSWNLIPYLNDGEDRFKLYLSKIIYNNANPDILYTTGYGSYSNDSVQIYKSTDGGEYWSLSYKEYLKDCGGILDFFQYQNRLILVTMNRGVYQLNLDLLSHVQLPNLQSIDIYPNPVADGFYVNGLTHSAQLALVDASGYRIFSKQVVNGEYIHVNFLPQGLYILELTTDRGIIRRKIIKN